MSTYVYNSKPDDLFEEIAEKIRDLFKFRASDSFKTDIEGIIDDLNIRIIPRRWPEKLAVEAYAAKDPWVIVIHELLFSNPRYRRAALAEELAHRVLEWEIWKEEEMPKGALCHELSDEQYRLIEDDAEKLALALLLPASLFTQQFKTHERALVSGAEAISKKGLHKDVRAKLASEFDADLHHVSLRMLGLGLIDKSTYDHLAPAL